MVYPTNYTYNYEKTKVFYSLKLIHIPEKKPSIFEDWREKINPETSSVQSPCILFVFSRS